MNVRHCLTAILAKTLTWLAAVLHPPPAPAPSRMATPARRGRPAPLHPARRIYPAVWCAATTRPLTPPSYLYGQNLEADRGQCNAVRQWTVMEEKRATVCHFTWSQQVHPDVPRRNLFSKRAREAFKTGFTGTVGTLAGIPSQANDRTWIANTMRKGLECTRDKTLETF